MGIISWISGFFLDTTALYALLALVPIIILYLIRPRPKYEALPSLMFLLKGDMKKKHWTFLRYLLQDPLLWLQLLAIIIIALSFAKPFIMTDTSAAIETQYVIIDASASMGADYNSITRLQEAKELAIEQLLSSNTIISASNQAIILDESTSPPRAKILINNIEQTDTPTRLYEAISLASEQAQKGDRILIFSDFQDKDIISVRNLINSIEAREIEVHTEVIISNIENVGFIDVDIGTEKTKFVIKNFDSVPRDIHVEISENNILNISLDAQSQFEQTITTPEVPTQIIIQEEDSLMADNVLYLSTNMKQNLRALYITNNVHNNFKTALDLIDGLEVVVQNPPNIFDVDGYDIIIINDVKSQFLLPGTIKKIRKEVEDGATLIIAAQESLFGIDLKKLFPIYYISTHEASSELSPATINRLTENIQFGFATNYFLVTLVDDDSTTVLVADNADNPLVTYSSYEDGAIFYYGIRDEYADFSETPYYPIFWKRVIDFSAGMRDLSELNQKTSISLSNSERESVKTPQGTNKQPSLSLSYSGFYEFDEYTVAANLLDELESSTQQDSRQISQLLEDNGTQEGNKIEKMLVNTFLWLAFIVIMLELLFMKFRGDV